MSVNDAAVVITRHLHEVLHSIHATYFPDRPYIETAELTYIVNEILFAENERRPLSVRGLAKLLNMPHTTLLLRLAALERHGLIPPRAKRLRSDKSVILSPAGRAKVHRVRQLIIDNGRELAKINV